MKPLAKVTLCTLIIFACLGGWNAYAETEPVAETDNTREFLGYKVSVPDFLSKENLKDKGEKLKQYYDNALDFADGAGVDIRSKIDDAKSTATDFISADSWNQRIDRYAQDAKNLEIVNDALNKYEQAKESAANAEVSIRSNIDNAKDTANDLLSAESWSQRLDGYADDIKNHEIVVDALDKYEKVKEPVVTIVTDPMNSAVVQKAKEIKNLPKSLIIKIVIIVVIILVIIGIIKAIINKINEMRNKLLVKAGKFVLKKGVEHVKNRQAAKAAAMTDTNCDDSNEQ